MRASRLLAVVLLAPPVVGTGITAGANASLAEMLLQPRSAPELVAMPKLREKLEKGPHDYLRGTNALFVRAVCERYEPALKSLPAVTLHGDAHIEQYSVTDRGRGLNDFDDSAIGSAFIDLVRFATSIRLTTAQRGWPDADKLIDAFLNGYEKALRAPSTIAAEPAAVSRIRKTFDSDRIAQLARAEQMMVPLPPERQPPPEHLAHVALVLGEAAHRSPAFFHVKKMGGLTIGIGSAADEKYLMRIEGPTSAPGDDMMLEIKEVKPLPAVNCIYGVRDATRVLLAEKSLAYEPFAIIGSLVAGDRYFWFHTWTSHYAEMKIDKSFENAGELREVVYDAGVQLGRGHPGRVSEDAAAELRKVLLKNVRKAPIVSASAELAAATREAWQTFKAASP